MNTKLYLVLKRDKMAGFILNSAHASELPDCAAWSNQTASKSETETRYDLWSPVAAQPFSTTKSKKQHLNVSEKNAFEFHLLFSISLNVTMTIVTLVLFPLCIKDSAPYEGGNKLKEKCNSHFS